MAEFDVVILGGGPGGYACALRCADLGLTVALVEAELVGGTCLHRGCIPTRAMLQAASVADAVTRGAGRWGIRAAVETIDWEDLVASRDEVVNLNHKAVERHLSNARVEVVRGAGRLAGPRTVAVDGAPPSQLRARRAVVLATGSAPRSLAGLGTDGHRVLDSDQAMNLDHIPESVVILGAGAIGAEFCQVWRALGADVTLVEIQPSLVPTEDPDVGREFARALRRRGIRSLTGAHLRDATVREDRVDLAFTTGDETVHDLSAEVVLLAIGRDARTADLGYEDAGVRLADGFVEPADWETLETHAPGVYAIGDLLPPPSLARAHVAYAEGRLVADEIAGAPSAAIDYPGVSRVTHGIIETAAVGLTEAQARARGAEIEVRKLPLGGVAKGLILGEGGMVKVVADRGGAVLGMHFVGPHVSELVGEGMLITDFEATPADVAPLVHPHPTLSEAIAEVHMALAGRPLHLR